MVKDSQETRTKIVGASLKNLPKLMAMLAAEKKPVLLIGDRGTGKELCARLYQEESDRDNFAPLNCAGMNDEVLLSELFGHEKGSFTGAHKKRGGLISRYKDNGVIFLDELGDASEIFQAALLRFLETGDYKALGSDEIINTSGDQKKSLIIAATSKPKKIREDLKDRFISIFIPPLVERYEDIASLLKAFTEGSEVNFISKTAFDALYDLNWTGNVRQFKRVLEEAILLCKAKSKTDCLRATDFPIFLSHPKGIYLSQDNSKKMLISNLEESTIANPIDYFFVEAINDPRRLMHDTSLPKSEDEEKEERMELEKGRDEAIISAMKLLEKKLNSLLPDQAAIDRYLEKIPPKEYVKEFWNYHVKKGSTGGKIEKLFKIPKSTVNKNLKKARERIGLDKK